jgi:NADPH-dependent curcumin reductase CurA
MINNAIILKNKPVGLPKLTDFELVEESIPVAVEGEVLLKSIYISVDPYLRGKMAGTHGASFEIGKPLASKVIAEVIESKNSHFKSGEFVSNYLQWKKYQLSDGTGLARRLMANEGKLTYSETIMNGFDKLPEAFLGLFEGKNEGKMIVAAEGLSHTDKYTHK